MRTNTIPLEAETRVLIDHSLESLGWKLKGKGKNVYFEQPKTEVERKKLDGKRPDYVLYSGEKPLIVIEAKKKGARIDAALEQGIDYARAIDAPLVFATDGVFCKTYHTVANRPPLLNGEEIDELIREALALRFLTSFEVNTISPKVQYDRKELIRIFDEANNMLRGDGLRAGIERFGEFANILFLKLVSENEQFKKESGIKSAFDISSCSWDSIKNIAASARIEYINNTVYPRLNKLYQTEIFTPLTIRDDTILKEIMDKLDPLTLTDVDSDVKGDAFEYFLKASTATKNDLGEYFTPRHIVKTMVRLVNPKIGEKIYDPFCGTGGFLIEAFRHIERNMGTGNPELRRILREETIFGNEITNTARITKMNMILAGDGHSNIHMVDSLANPTYIDKIKYNEKGEIVRDKEGNIEYSSEYTGIYDVVITNMPYSQKTKHGNLYDLPSTNGDSICVQHCMKAISSTADNGRMALVVPEGFLFRKDLARTREYFLNHCELQSVISLPQGVFLPYTGVKTDIIYATKVNQKIKRSNQKKNFWYFEVKSDGLTLDNHRRKDSQIPNDLAKFEEYRKLDVDQAEDMLKVGFEIIPLDKVRHNAFILVGSRYRESQVISSKYDVVTIGDVATLINGFAFPVGLQGGKGSIPFYKVGDMNTVGNEVEMHTSKNYVSQELADEQKWRIAPKGTVIFPKIGAAIATNKKRILSEAAIFDNNVMGIICSDKILPKYMLYTLNSIDISTWASLANPPSISRDVVLEHKIPLPSLDAQQQIISELDEYQKIINSAKTIVRNYTPHVHLSGDYSIVKLCDVCSINEQSVNPEQAYGENSFIYIDISSVEGKTGKIDKSQVMRGVDAPSRARRAFHKGDILFSTVRPNLKAFTYIDFETAGFVASTGFAVLTPKKINGKYLLYMLLDDYVGNQLNAAMSKAMYPSVNKSDIENIDILLPEREEQDEIVKNIETELALITPAEDMISLFSRKIETKMRAIWG